jgi:hypothetical protein
MLISGKSLLELRHMKGYVRIQIKLNVHVHQAHEMALPFLNVEGFQGFGRSPIKASNCCRDYSFILRQEVKCSLETWITYSCTMMPTLTVREERSSLPRFFAQLFCDKK